MKNALLVLFLVMGLASSALADEELIFGGVAQHDFEVGVDPTNGIPEGFWSFKNATGTFFGAPISADLKIGYGHDAIVQLDSKIILVGDPRVREESKFYVVAPFLGGLHLYPSRNQVGNGLGDGMSSEGTMGGVGMSVVRKLKDGERPVDAGVDVAFQEEEVSEMLPPGAYTQQGAVQMSRESDNTIDAKGYRIRVTAELAALDRALVSASGSFTRVAQEQDSSISYYDAQGELYAKVRLKKYGGWGVNLYGEYGLRVNNYTDLGSRQVIQFVSSGLDFSYVMEKFRR